MAAGRTARGVDAQVMRLRRRLEPDPRRPLVLRTVRGEGYVLVPGEHAGGGGGGPDGLA